jgi:hypothetical protein
MHIVGGTEAAPFQWRLAFYVPEGFDPTDVSTCGVPVAERSTTQEGQVLRVSFDALESGALDLWLRFPAG